jgi:hypothetical protein
MVIAGDPSRSALIGSPFFQLSRAARNESRANSASTGPALFGPAPQPVAMPPAATKTTILTIWYLANLDMVDPLWLELSDDFAAVSTAHGPPGW